jgi:transcription elongation factor GreB
MAALMEIVAPGAQPPERVVFGATVTVRGKGREERTYRIVGVDESDPARGWVSWISPVARALTGRKPGDTVKVTLPAGEKLLTIVSIGIAPV